MKNKHTLTLRLTAALMIFSLITSAIIMQFYYQKRYGEEVANAMTAIDQLQRTTSNTTSVAAYLKDQDVAQEVINGLLKNDTVYAIKIISNEQELAKSTLFNAQHARVYPLYSPFFISEVIGQIFIVPNQQVIARAAGDIAFDSALLLLIQTAVMLSAFIILAYFIITNPMTRLSEQLQHINPIGTNRLPITKSQRNTEIGKIAFKINTLLDKSQYFFQREVMLRSEIETLEKRLRLLFDTTSSGTILAHENGDVLLYNNSTKALFDRLGIPLATNFKEMVNRAVKTPDALFSHMRNAFEHNNVANGEFEFINHCDDEACWVNILVTRNQDDANNTYLQIFLTDISEHKAKLKKLSKVAHFDKLTDILNRHGAELAINKQIKSQTPFALMIIDLDGFKPINDSYGHNAGDTLLQHVAKKIDNSLRKEDICGRWGGDEFVVCITEVESSNALLLAEKLRMAISDPIAITYKDRQIQVRVGASIGVALFPQHGISLTHLVHAADVAMYQAKNNKKNSAYIYLG